MHTTPKRQIIPAGIEKIKKAEALRLFAYPDPAQPLAKKTRGMGCKWGFRPAIEIIKELPPHLRELPGEPWTVGYGHTKGVTMFTQCDDVQAQIWLDEDLDAAQCAVEHYVKVPLNDFQYAALVSFVFNVGVAAFAASTLLKKLNKGDYAAVPAELDKWCKVKNKLTGVYEVNEGLQNRRNLEKAIWNTPILEEQPKEPEIASAGTEVAKPEPKKISRTLTGNVIAAAGTAGGVVAEQWSDTAKLTKEASVSLAPLATQSSLITTVCALLIVGGLILSIYAKMQDRNKELG